MKNECWFQLLGAGVVVYVIFILATIIKLAIKYVW